MKNENAQNKEENNTQKAGVRVSQPTKKIERNLITEANAMTKFGHKVTSEDLYSLALGLVTTKHLKELKLSKITGDDYDDMLLSKFKSTKLGSTSSDFRNFQRTPDWSKFLKENKPENLLSEFVG